MKSSFLFKPFNRWIVTVCFAVLPMLLIPAKGFAVAVPPSSGGPDFVCQSATPSAFTLSGASIGFPANTGAWSITSGGGTLSNTAQTSTPALVTYTPAANYSGIVTLTLTTDFGATTIRTTTVYALPVVSAPSSVSVGGTITLSPTTGGTWISSDNAKATVTNAGLVTGVAAGTATFNFTDTTTGCSSTTSSVAVYACSFLSNSDFEISTPNPATFNWIPEANVPPWYTTGSYGEIEIWNGAGMGVPAYSGSQFAELNARQVGTLYQTFAAVSGVSVMISFAHRGRYTNPDKMEVQIGPAAGPYVTIGSYYDNYAGGWSYYSVPYTFPSSGSYQLRFASIYSNGGAGPADGGNFLDAITVSCPSGGPTVTPGGPDNVCQSATPAAIILSGASVGGSATTGAWSITSGGGTLSSTAQTASPETVTYTPAANYNGTVILKLTTNGSPAVSATRTVSVNTLPAAPVSNHRNSICMCWSNNSTGRCNGRWNLVKRYSGKYND